VANRIKLINLQQCPIDKIFYILNNEEMLRSVFILCSFCFSFSSFSQNNIPVQIPRPKLVVGIVVDQMRWDYLYRYFDLYGNNGFKRLLREGLSCENTLIPYLPTYTAPGHACIYTGSVPAIHGIIGNNWYERSINKSVYCTDDSTVSSVGGTATWGKNSPRNMWTTTIGDELRLSNNFKSKVFGVSIKDRASIIPAGHSANAAYWYDEAQGKWITSTYYMKELPAWVKDINSKDIPGDYMSKEWKTLLPLEKYDQSTTDLKEYEGKITGETSVGFPHNLSSVANKKYDAFKTTPFANTYTLNMAKAIVENEKLGNNKVTDFLAINIAATDFIGHAFGPNSIEVEDAYLRLDIDLAAFLQFLDIKMGKGNYLLFLSADHGVSQVPGFLTENSIPAGIMNQGALMRDINQLIEKKYDIKNGILNLQNYQVYLNTEWIEKNNKPLAEIKQFVVDQLKRQPYILNAFETEKISVTSIPEPMKKMLINGYNPKRSGDIHFILRSGYQDRGSTGTTHGSWSPYDAHIPLVWFGWRVKHGTINRETYMTDIAATLAAMLKIQMPGGCVGKVIEEVLK
jgi:predicted AlkP superfamily pyrophosphatase or phosphodiesterase